MHETAIAAGIIAEAKKHGAVKAIRLEIGELAHVPADELIECLKKLVPWNIHAKTLPAIVMCHCGFKGRPTILERGHDFFLIECPKCKATPDLRSGTDITLVSVEVN